MHTYTRRAWDVVAWAYDADVHCPDCAEKRFNGDFDWTDEGSLVRDSEGNVPHPVFASDEYDGDHCGTCREPIE